MDGGKGISAEDILTLAIPLAAAGTAFVNPKATTPFTQGLGTTVQLMRQREALEQQKREAEELGKARTRGLGLEERRTAVTEQEAVRRAGAERSREEAFRFISGLPLSKTLSVAEPLQPLPPGLDLSLPPGPETATLLGATANVPPTFADIQGQIAASQLSPQAQAAASEIAFGAPQRFPAQQAVPEPIQRAQQAIAARRLFQERGVAPEAALAAAQLIQAGGPSPSLELLRSEEIRLANTGTALVPITREGQPVPGAKPIPITKDFRPSVGFQTNDKGELLIVTADPESGKYSVQNTKHVVKTPELLEGFTGPRAIVALLDIVSGRPDSPRVPPALRDFPATEAKKALAMMVRQQGLTGIPAVDAAIEAAVGKEPLVGGGEKAPGTAPNKAAPVEGRLERQPDGTSVFVPGRR